MVASTAEGRRVTEPDHSLQRVWHKICPSWGFRSSDPAVHIRLKRVCQNSGFLYPPHNFAATGLLCLSLLLVLIVPTAAQSQTTKAFWGLNNVSLAEGTTQGLQLQVTQNIATATHGTDYTFGTGVTYANGVATFTIPANTQRFTGFNFDLMLLADSVSDNGETIILTINDTNIGQGNPHAVTITVTEDTGTPEYEIRGDPHVGEVLTVHRTTDDPDGGVQTEVISWQVPIDGQADQQVQAGGTSYTPTTFQLGFPINAKVVYTDGNGNKKVFYTNSLGPIGSARPRVVDITRQGSPQTDADSLTWRVRFNELVKDVDAADFSLSGSTAVLSVSPVAGDANAWDVTANGGDLANLNGRVTLGFASGQNIKNAADVGLRDTTPTGTNEPTYEVSNDAVTVSPTTTAVLATDAGLTRFGRTVGQQAVDAVRGRIGTDRTQGLVARLAGESLPRIGGDPVFSELPGPESGGDGFGSDGEEDVARVLHAEDFLTGTSFTLNTMGEDGTSLAFWGSGSVSQFRGTSDGIGLEGDVRDIMLGADQGRSHHLVGLLVMGSRGEITYGLDEDTGRLDTSLTSLVPYGRLHARNGLTYWGAVGIGWGTMTLTPGDEDSVRSDLDWHMVSGGVEGSLSGVSLIPEAQLVWHSDVLWTRTTSEPVADLPRLGGETARVRVGVDATWSERALLDGFVTPEVGMGLRYDGGDAETGFGLEVRSGLRWRDPKGHFSLSVAGRTLAVHDEGAFKDWGLSVGVFWDPHPETKEGFSAAFGYDLGAGSVDGDALPGPEVSPGQGAAEGATSWRSEVAYGVSRGGGLVGSPYGGIGGTSEAIDEARVGYRIEPDTPHAENMRVDVWTDPVAGNEEKSAGAGLTWSW